MKLSTLLFGMVVADRLDRKDININALDSEWALEDDEDIDDLHHMDPRKAKQGMDTTKLNGRDHTTTWSQSKKGQQMGLYVTPVPDLSQEELTTLFDIWQLNMLNCCNLEIQFLPIEQSTMLVLLSDGKFLHDFATMLRNDKKCHSFTVENTKMFCGGHPEWDPKFPGKSDQAVKWDPVHEKEAKDKKRAQAEVWNEDDIQKTLEMKNQETRGQKIEL